MSKKKRNGLAADVSRWTWCPEAIHVRVYGCIRRMHWILIRSQNKVETGGRNPSALRGGCMARTPKSRASSDLCIDGGSRRRVSDQVVESPSRQQLLRPAVPP